MRLSLALLVAVSLLAVGSVAGAEKTRTSPTNGPIAAVGDGGIYLFDAPGGGKHLVRGTAQADDYEWSPDGRTLAFDTGSADDGYWTDSAVYTVRQGVAELAAMDAWSPAWLRDGSGVVFMREVATPVKFPGLPTWEDWNIATYASGVDGSDPRRLTGFVEAGDDAFAVSPDGKWVAYSSFGVNRVRLDGTGRERIVREEDVSELAWSPDGRRLAFVAGEEAFVVDADGAGLRRLGGSGDMLQSLTWSPDGSTIAAERLPTGPPWGELVLVDVDSGETRLLLRRPLAGVAPAWSPDGKQLVFAAPGDVCGSDRLGDLWVTTADATELHRLAKGCWGRPSWLPSAPASS